MIANQPPSDARRVTVGPDDKNDEEPFIIKFPKKNMQSRREEAAYKLGV